jgi:[acyl-carrier-protein] S-malonyltransferase
MASPGGRTDQGLTIHLFPGQGDFALTPLLRALAAVPVLCRAVAETFDAADPVGEEFGVRPIGPRLRGLRPPSAAELAAEAPGTVQLALFGVCLAVHRALTEVGLGAQRLIAVSFGEIPALTAAGAYRPADGARLACRLGQLLQARSEGGLTLLRASEQQTGALLDRAATRQVVIACVNDAAETVVSGPEAELLALEAAAGRAGIQAQRLRLPFLSHHPALQREADRFEAFARSLPVRPLALPVHSAVAGCGYTHDSDLPRALANCLIRPAQLPSVLRQAARGPARFIESGTGSALARSVGRTLPAALVQAPVADPDFHWGPEPADGQAPLNSRKETR